MLAAVLVAAAVLAWRSRPMAAEGLVLQTQPLLRTLQFS
ncbi:MAG: hypothetical protein RL227_629, partial [Pseudomonadota bacterium]